MTDPTCPMCSGRRSIPIARGKLVQGPGICFRHPLLTVTQLERCPTCDGRGRIATADLLAAERARTTAEQAAWEAQLPDHLAIALERDANGDTPW